MRQEEVSFFSEGETIVGSMLLPEGAGPHPAIVQGPGWLGLRDAGLYVPYHEGLTEAGFAVLIFDYRGFGDSGGARGALSPAGQLQDLINAVTYVQTRDDVAGDDVGVFGSGGTGGGNAVLLAGSDRRVACAVSQVPVADGADWLRRMRREHEWYEFLDRLADDRKRRVLTGSGELVHPREEIMVPAPERAEAQVKKDVDGRIPDAVPLAAADEILAYRPIDAAPRARALLVIAVEDDAVTPTDHAVALYEAAPEPKKLILQRGAGHYAAYRRYGDTVIPQIVDWFESHLRSWAVKSVTPTGESTLRERT